MRWKVRIQLPKNYWKSSPVTMLLSSWCDWIKVFLLVCSLRNKLLLSPLKGNRTRSLHTERKSSNDHLTHLNVFKFEFILWHCHWAFVLDHMLCATSRKRTYLEDVWRLCPWNLHSKNYHNGLYNLSVLYLVFTTSRPWRLHFQWRWKRLRPVCLDLGAR